MAEARASRARYFSLQRDPARRRVALGVARSKGTDNPGIPGEMGHKHMNKKKGSDARWHAEAQPRCKQGAGRARRNTNIYITRH